MVGPTAHGVVVASGLPTRHVAIGVSRKALEAARGELSAWLAVEGLTEAQGAA